MQYLWQLTQISFVDVSTNAMIRVFYVGSHKMKSILSVAHPVSLQDLLKAELRAHTAFPTALFYLPL